VAGLNFHPSGEAEPITVKQLFPEVKKIRSYGNGYEIKWLESNRPHPTLGKDHSQKPTRWLIGGKEYRPSTLQLALISSFGPSYRFAGNANNAWNQIGNSVPPLFMRAIASRVRELISKGPAIRTPSPTGNYLATLEAAWADHLKPRESDAPTVISTFAGGGGSSLGYSMAGYRELLAVEWDKNAIETFHLNFPRVPFYHGDIAKLTVAECLRMAQVEPGQLDVLDGSPPCQGFSTAGKRNLDDPRNSLFKEFVRLLRGLKPKAFVMENVSGMVKGKMKLVFAEILRELKASGYKVKARLLNAMYFGVPQSRQRMIFIGIREDLQIEPSHPKGQSKPTTVREAYHSVRNDELEHQALIDSGKKYAVYQDWQGMKPGDNGRFGDFYKLHPERPARTLSKIIGDVSCRGVMDWREKRRPTIAEMKRLGSYPDHFIFTGSFADKGERIGNSVPPLFMRAIALHVKELLVGSILTPALS
jgi:DNA (cytosine-5)-methyltransferase 1